MLSNKTCFLYLVTILTTKPEVITYSIYCSLHFRLRCRIVILEVTAAATTERGTGVGVTVEMIETLAAEDTIETTVVAEEAADEIVALELNGRDNHYISRKH